MLSLLSMQILLLWCCIAILLTASVPALSMTMSSPSHESSLSTLSLDEDDVDDDEHTVNDDDEHVFDVFAKPRVYASAKRQERHRYNGIRAVRRLRWTGVHTTPAHERRYGRHHETGERVRVNEHGHYHEHGDHISVAFRAHGHDFSFNAVADHSHFAPTFRWDYYDRVDDVDAAVPPSTSIVPTVSVYTIDAPHVHARLMVHSHAPDRHHRRRPRLSGVLVVDGHHYEIDHYRHVRSFLSPALAARLHAERRAMLRDGFQYDVDDEFRSASAADVDVSDAATPRDVDDKVYIDDDDDDIDGDDDEDDESDAALGYVMWRLGRDPFPGQDFSTRRHTGAAAREEAEEKAAAAAASAAYFNGAFAVSARRHLLQRGGTATVLGDKPRSLVRFKNCFTGQKDARNLHLSLAADASFVDAVKSNKENIIALHGDDYWIPLGRSGLSVEDIFTRLVSDTSLWYSRQMNMYVILKKTMIRTRKGGPDWNAGATGGANSKCRGSVIDQLHQFSSWVLKNKQTRLVNGQGSSQWGLLTKCAFDVRPTIVGIAKGLGTCCTDRQPGFVQRLYGGMSGTFAHELGHTINAAHPFSKDERKKSKTGGFLDYGPSDKSYKGIMQFNPKSNMQNICGWIRKMLTKGQRPCLSVRRGTPSGWPPTAPLRFLKVPPRACTSRNTKRGGCREKRDCEKRFGSWLPQQGVCPTDQKCCIDPKPCKIGTLNGGCTSRADCKSGFHTDSRTCTGGTKCCTSRRPTQPTVQCTIHGGGTRGTCKARSACSSTSSYFETARVCTGGTRCCARHKRCTVNGSRGTCQMRGSGCRSPKVVSQSTTCKGGTGCCTAAAPASTVCAVQGQVGTCATRCNPPLVSTPVFGVCQGREKCCHPAVSTSPTPPTPPTPPIQPTPVTPTPPPTGEQETHIGFLADRYCWRQPGHVGIDGVDLSRTPARHSLHCLYDIPQCRDSGFVVLTKPQGSRRYSVKLDLDTASDAKARALLKAGVAAGRVDDARVEVRGRSAGAKFAIDTIIFAATDAPSPVPPEPTPNPKPDPTPTPKQPQRCANPFTGVPGRCIARSKCVAQPNMITLGGQCFRRKGVADMTCCVPQTTTTTPTPKKTTTSYEWRPHKQATPCSVTCSSTSSGSSSSTLSYVGVQVRSHECVELSTSATGTVTTVGVRADNYCSESPRPALVRVPCSPAPPRCPRTGGDPVGGKCLGHGQCSTARTTPDASCCNTRTCATDTTRLSCVRSDAIRDAVAFNDIAKQWIVFRGGRYTPYNDIVTKTPTSPTRPLTALRGFPTDIIDAGGTVDAVCSRYAGTVLLFSGRRVFSYVFDGGTEHGFPVTMDDTMIPRHWPRVDAAFAAGGNTCYLFHAREYVVYDFDRVKRGQPGLDAAVYPLPLSYFFRAVTTADTGSVTSAATVAAVPQAYIDAAHSDGDDVIMIHKQGRTLRLRLSEGEVDAVVDTPSPGTSVKTLTTTTTPTADKCDVFNCVTCLPNTGGARCKQCGDGLKLTRDGRRCTPKHMIVELLFDAVDDPYDARHIDVARSTLPRGEASFTQGRVSGAIKFGVTHSLYMKPIGSMRVFDCTMSIYPRAVPRLVSARLRRDQSPDVQTLLHTDGSTSMSDVQGHTHVQLVRQNTVGVNGRSVAGSTFKVRLLSGVFSVTSSHTLAAGAWTVINVGIEESGMYVAFDGQRTDLPLDFLDVITGEEDDDDVDDAHNVVETGEQKSFALRAVGNGNGNGKGKNDGGGNTQLGSDDNKHVAFNRWQLGAHTATSRDGFVGLIDEVLISTPSGNAAMLGDKPGAAPLVPDPPKKKPPRQSGGDEKPATSSSPTDDKKTSDDANSMTIVIIAAVAGVALCAAVGGVVYCCVQQRRSQRGYNVANNQIIRNGYGGAVGGTAAASPFDQQHVEMHTAGQPMYGGGGGTHRRGDSAQAYTPSAATAIQASMGTGAMSRMRLYSEDAPH